MNDYESPAKMSSVWWKSLGASKQSHVLIDSNAVEQNLGIDERQSHLPDVCSITLWVTTPQQLTDGEWKWLCWRFLNEAKINWKWSFIYEVTARD